MSIATGLAKAQELGFPLNLAEMARVAAAGASIMSTINGASFSGNYDSGGQIPAGKFGIVGEYGPEIVSGPARVTGRRKTAEELARSGGGGNVNVVINNNAGVNVSTSSTSDEEGTRLQIMIEETKRSIVSEIATGTGDVPRVLEGTYAGLRRGQS